MLLHKKKTVPKKNCNAHRRNICEGCGHHDGSFFKKTMSRTVNRLHAVLSDDTILDLFNKSVDFEIQFLKQVCQIKPIFNVLGINWIRDIIETMDKSIKFTNIRLIPMSVIKNETSM